MSADTLAAPAVRAADSVAPLHAAANHAEAFRELGRQHPLWKHELLERCRSGRLGLAEVRTLAVQMYKFSREFSRYLAAALAACAHEEARIVIAENLWEELGEGDLAQSHPVLFRRFTRAIGIDDKTLEATPPEPETQALIDTYLGFAERYGVVGALGAICYSSEGIVGALYSHLQNGLVRSIPFERDALVFFDLHIHVDDGHAAQLEKVLGPLVRSREDFDRVSAAIQQGLDARCRFFDGVLRAAARRPVGATADVTIAA